MKNWFQMKAVDNTSAEISIYDEIGAWGVTAKDFINEFKSLSAENITLIVNSPGGSVFDALAIYNTIAKCGKKVKAKVMGVAASAASFIVMGAGEIEMPENAFMMIHNPMGVSFGNAEDMRDMADLLDKLGASLLNVYVARSGQSEEKVKEMLDAETWLTAVEAKELGFCDVVTENMKLAACFETDRLPQNIQDVLKAVQEPEASEAEGTDDISAGSSDAPTFTDQIVATAERSGLSIYANVFALDTNIKDADSLDAAIVDAREIVSLCAVAGVPAEAEKHIRARTSPADVRVALMNALAKADEQSQTDGTLPTEGSAQGTAKPTASVSTASIWASRRS